MARARDARRARKERESELLAAYAADRTPENRNRIVEFHMDLADMVSKKMHRALPRCVDLPDLRQAAAIGLIEAVERFRPAKGTCLRTYAAHVIRGRVLDQLRALDWVPRQVRSRRTAAEKLAADMAAEANRPVGLDEALMSSAAAPGDVSGWLRDVADVPKVMHYTAAGEKAGDADTLEAMADRPQDGEADSERERLAADVWRTALKSLNDRQWVTVEMHYRYGLPFGRVGEILGVSESRACQLHREALTVLRGALNPTGAWKWSERRRSRGGVAASPVFLWRRDVGLPAKGGRRRKT